MAPDPAGGPALPIQSEVAFDAPGKQVGYLGLAADPGRHHRRRRAGSGTSPLDGGNLNRSFPGHARGTPTQVIADHRERSLLPRAQVVIDLHSGGSSLLYHGATPSAQREPDARRQARLLAAMQAFGLPLAFVNESPNPVGLLAAAWRFSPRLPR